MDDADRLITALRAELHRRRADNPGYSVRAFAAGLAFDHAALSRILRGERSPDARTRRRLWDGLRPDRDTRSLLALAEAVAAPADSARCAELLRIDRDRVNVALTELLRDGRIQLEGDRWVRTSSNGSS